MFNLDIRGIEDYQWNCTSGQIIITDPSREEEDMDRSLFQILGIVEAVKGTWNVAVSLEEPTEEDSDPILTFFSTWHSDAQEAVTVATAEEGWFRASFSLGIDTGMVGLFDYSIYPKDADITTDVDPYEDFYNQMCDIADEWIIQILSNTKGVLMRSGTGDGIYPCYLRKNSEGVIDAIQICLLKIPAEEEEEMVPLPTA